MSDASIHSLQAYLGRGEFPECPPGLLHIHLRHILFRYNV